MSTALNLAMQITANTEGVSAAVRNVNASLNDMAASGKKAAQDLGVLKTIELSRVFLSAVTSAAGSFQSLVTGSASAVAAIDDLSNRTGASTDALQAYQFAAEQSGVGVETFGRSIQKLSLNLGEAQTGNAAAISAFQDLGLSVQELAGLRPELAFEKVAAAISALPNPAQQAAAAVSLFGKSGVDLVPVFAQGADYLSTMREEAESLGLVLSQQQVSALAGLDDSLSRVSAGFQALTQRIVAELAPGLSTAADNFARFLGSIDVTEVVGNLRGAFGALSQATSSAASALAVIYAVAAPIASAVFPALATALSTILSNLRGIALGAGAGAAAFGIYSVATGAASAATLAFAASIRTLLASTGVGTLLVVIGAVAGGLAEYAFKANEATSTVATGLGDMESAMDRTQAKLGDIIADAGKAGEQLAETFRTPAAVTNEQILDNTVKQAEQAFRQFAFEAGAVENIPVELAKSYENLRSLIVGVNDGTIDAASAEQEIARQARQVVQFVEQQNAAREAGAAQAREFAQQQEQAAAEAKRLDDERARRAAQYAAQEQALADKVFAKYVEIETERVAGLTRRFNEPLKVADVRSSEGIGQFLALATGREDPALSEARKQTAELEGLRTDLREFQAQKAEIMGGA